MSAEGQRLLTLEQQLAERVIGQDEAIRTLSDAIRRGRTGLKDPKRPIGSFLFLGSSGVGKTELCLALSEALFGTEDALIRLDMSEYMEKHSISRMIGSPPGYVGFEEGGQLTEKIRRRPYSVVLFDEIEKAHSDVYNILLQILEDGTLTDSQGRRVDFKNCVLILTSNVGSSNEGKHHLPGFSPLSDSESRRAAQEEARQERLKQTFRPEFLNRLDAILTFAPLGREQLMSIARRQMALCAQRLYDMHITMEFDDTVIERLIQAADNPSFGARPLRREVTGRIENMLATLMLEGKLSAGDHVRIVTTPDGYTCHLRPQQHNDSILPLPPA
jgi:ATP-dependent Clp protease ATP-binding subunit ClpC